MKRSFNALRVAVSMLAMSVLGGCLGAPLQFESVDPEEVRFAGVAPVFSNVFFVADFDPLNPGAGQWDQIATTSTGGPATGSAAMLAEFLQDLLLGPSSDLDLQVFDVRVSVPAAYWFDATSAYGRPGEVFAKVRVYWASDTFVTQLTVFDPPGPDVGCLQRQPDHWGIKNCSHDQSGLEYNELVVFAPAP